MKIRGRNIPGSADHSVSSASSSVSSSSSITAANSPLASSQDSSYSSPLSLFVSTKHRCHGLDLLVKAIHQVTAGSVIGVPYIQRRVIIRRRRRMPFSFSDLFVFSDQRENERKQTKKGKKISMQKRKSEAMGEEICN